MRTEQEIRECLALWETLKARDLERYEEFDPEEVTVRISMLYWVLGE